MFLWIKRIALGSVVLSLLVSISALIWLLVTLKQIENGKYGDIEDIEFINPTYKATAQTKVYSTDGKVLASYYTNNHVNVPFDSLSTELVQCLIASEDPRHFSSYRKSSFVNCLSVPIGAIFGHNRGLSSHISNQLRPLIFTQTHGSQFSNILRQPVAVSILEKHFSKEELVAIYLNQVDFLYGAYGIHAASKSYFDKSPSQLNWQEAASFVAMLNTPALYDVRRNKDTTLWARNQVFQKLANQGTITASQRDSLSKLDIVLKAYQSFEYPKPALQFRVQVRRFLEQWQEEHGYNIYRDGLKVYTTLDHRLQQHAQKAAQGHLRYLQKEFNQHWKGRDLPWVANASLEEQIHYSRRYLWLVKKIKKKYERSPTKDDIALEFGEPQDMSVFSYRGTVDTNMSPLDSALYYKQLLQASVLALDPKTGAIRVWVGGINHPHFMQDYVNTPRRAGSALLPFVYSKAFESGFTPCSTLRTTTNQQNHERLFISTNWDHLPLVQALATSQNSTAFALIDHIGEQEVLNHIHSFGITPAPLPSYQGLLTDHETSLLEMTAAYNVFNNGGQHVTPYFISRIEDSEGNILEAFESEKRTVLDSAENYLMLQMLEKVVQRGTAVRLISSHYYNIRTPLAGKTGTTQNGGDAWFFGFQPDITVGIWAGGQNPEVAFRDMRYGQGARTALPIFAEFVNAINSDEELSYGRSKGFPLPSQSSVTPIDCGFTR